MGFANYRLKASFMVKDIHTLLRNAKRIHFIGIGGSGMFPLVKILFDLGYTVTGSDIDDKADIVGYERKMGIKVNVPHHGPAVEGADAVVVTAALFAENPEVARANELGIPIIKRSELLGYITSLYKSAFCISGTHGKTTTTSALTQILFEAGKDPSAVIGGRLPVIEGYGRSGKSQIMTCEACEYVDTFLELFPDYAVILNIDRDHLDYFKTEERLSQSFTNFAKRAATAVIANGDDAKTVAALKGIDRPVIYFGTGDDCEYRISDIHRAESAFYAFTLTHGDDVMPIVLSIPGRHNVYNAAAAAVCAHIAGCTDREIADGILHFKGAGRRFEIVGHVDGITVADDYAHHPQEIAATLRAAKEMGYNRVIAVFQPFTFTRTKLLLKEFAEALSIADSVVMTKIMGAREEDDDSIHTKDLGVLIKGATWFDGFEEVSEYVMNTAKSGDLVVTLGCGDIYKAARMMVHYKDKQKG